MVGAYIEVTTIIGAYTEVTTMVRAYREVTTMVRAFVRVVVIIYSLKRGFQLCLKQNGGYTTITVTVNESEVNAVVGAITVVEVMFRECREVADKAKAWTDFEVMVRASI